jgi:hypothetical protein
VAVSPATECPQPSLQRIHPAAGKAEVNANSLRPKPYVSRSPLAYLALPFYANPKSDDRRFCCIDRCAEVNPRLRAKERNLVAARETCDARTLPRTFSATLAVFIWRVGRVLPVTRTSNMGSSLDQPTSMFLPLCAGYVLASPSRSKSTHAFRVRPPSNNHQYLDLQRDR